MAQTSSASEGVPNDEVMATASAGREEMASKLVHRFALGSGVAGLVPVCTENLNPDVMVMKSAKD